MVRRGWRAMIRRGVAAVCAAVALTACTATRNLNTDRLETEIQSGITEQTGQAVASVDCPEDVAIEAGNTFECTVNYQDGTTATVTVTQEDDEGNVRWVLNQT